MSESQYHDRAVEILNDKVNYIKNLIDNGYESSAVNSNLSGLLAKADFAHTLSIISMSEYQQFQNEWAELQERLRERSTD